MFAVCKAEKKKTKQDNFLKVSRSVTEDFFTSSYIRFKIRGGYIFPRKDILRSSNSAEKKASLQLHHNFFQIVTTPVYIFRAVFHFVCRQMCWAKQPKRIVIKYAVANSETL